MTVVCNHEQLSQNLWVMTPTPGLTPINSLVIRLHLSSLQLQILSTDSFNLETYIAPLQETTTTQRLLLRGATDGHY